MLKLAADRPVAAAVLGAFGIAFSAIFVRLADVPPEAAALFRCVYALPLLAWITRREDRAYGPRPRRARLFAASAGVFFGADLILWHHTIDAVGAGLATVLANMQVVMVGFIAWAVLRERPDGRLFISAPVSLLGVVLISGVLTQGEVYGSNPQLGVILGILTAVAYSGFLLLLRHSGGDLRRPAGPLFDTTAVAAVLSAAYGLAMGVDGMIPRSLPAHGWLLALAITSQVLAWLLITSSLPRLPAALTSVLLTIQPLGSVILGMILLGEEPVGMQLVGVALIVAALIVATARPRKAATAPKP